MKDYGLNLLKSSLFELTANYRPVSDPDIKRATITCSKDVAMYVRDIYPVDISHREAMICLYLNRRNNVVCYTVVSIGGVSGTFADNKIIFQHLLLANASSVIIIHNHPSGNLQPSNADIQLTSRAVEIGKLLDAPVLDHVIITGEGHYSFADAGKL
ncbi:JAB domain-containing protein [Parvicella tangerina]|uniref:MPN domain-containing protein n=1 Tax=Parvicella tangerina TaxID=2829795 RepID=A0A916JP62_9FLAO|nr:JAB domain-containing protein [Parvicella tangerina]CAG5085044.1 hypothetical protein CRYO30217_02633 [Parvicella tangerina]